jgi:type IV secretion system protein VirB5
MTTRISFRSLCILVLLTAAPAAHAQWAVVDVGAIAQLLQQVRILEQALSTARDEVATARGELTQAQQTFRGMSGDRGMESLLAGIDRNYLPGAPGDLQALLTGGPSPFAALASARDALVGRNAVLSPGQLAALSPAGAAQLQATRETTALLQAVAGEALENASGRFASLQQLISAIGGASDQKAILDLSARIAAEQAMLQNEQTKLDVLHRALQSRRWSDRLRARERIVALHGRFASRFAPVP